mmetsp:Transcript_17936/g.25013  ORF Transcript_17936/g.25013 Transcript_17936/m.25013 type:complete len:647 (-) Transcript_17936:103-2043(-)
MTDTTPIHSPKKPSYLSSPRRNSGSRYQPSNLSNHFHHQQVQEPQALSISRSILHQQHRLRFVGDTLDDDYENDGGTINSPSLNANRSHYFNQRISNQNDDGNSANPNSIIPNGHSQSSHANSPLVNNSFNGSNQHNAMSNNTENNSKPNNLWVELDLSSNGLRSITSQIGLYNHLAALYLNDNRITFLPEDMFNSLKSLRTLVLSSNLLTQVPKSLGMVSSLEKLYLDDNQIREIPVEFGRLFRLQDLRLSGNPITNPPREVIELSTPDFVGYLRDRIPMGQPPPDRRFISYIDTNTVVNDKDRLRVFSYNVLAESYATIDRYFYCPSWALDWNYRKQRILQEMLAYDCDILCLQEVEAYQYSTFFQPEMAKAGYSGVFTPKSRARTMEDWGTVDGCVIFFKKNKFSVVEEHAVEYQSIGMAKHKDFQDDPEAFSRLITKDNIAIIVILQVIGEQNSPPNGKSPMKNKWGTKNRHVLISNTHIHWNPDHADVKLMQVQLLLEQIAHITGPHTKWYKIPMILCGDFNSSADSGPYELISTGRLAPFHNDFCGFNYGTYTKQGMQHNFHLTSAYSPLGEPAFTNYTADFVGVLDYLWFTSDSLSVSKVLQPVDEEVVKVTRLPNAYMPSDHISILSEFYFASKKSEW